MLPAPQLPPPHTPSPWPKQASADQPGMLTTIEGLGLLGVTQAAQFSERIRGWVVDSLLPTLKYLSWLP